MPAKSRKNVTVGTVCIFLKEAKKKNIGGKRYVLQMDEERKLRLRRGRRAVPLFARRLLSLGAAGEVSHGPTHEQTVKMDRARQFTLDKSYFFCHREDIGNKMLGDEWS